MTTALTRSDTELSPPTTNPIRVLQVAIDRGVSAEQLERLSALVERWQVNEASAAFGRALAAFQHECPIIFKHQKADRYKFAGYEDIKAVTRPLETKHGLSVSFSQPKVEGGSYEIVVYLRVGAHQETRPFSVPVTNVEPILKQIASDAKINLAQAYGFWLSYQKRYAYCAALDVVVGREDTDASRVRDVTGEDLKARDAQLEAIRGVYTEIDMDADEEARFWAWVNVGSGNFADLPPERYGDVLVMLRRKLAAKRKAVTT